MTRLRRIGAWSLKRLRCIRPAVAGFVILAVGTTIALVAVQNEHAHACTDRKNQWTALHDVIVESYAPAKPSKAVLAAFPQLKPFYTPGNPAYEIAQRNADERQRAVLGKLGDKPSC